jgi:hypothetical protein
MSSTTEPRESGAQPNVSPDAMGCAALSHATVDHPTLGTITDPRMAYLAGMA